MDPITRPPATISPQSSIGPGFAATLMDACWLLSHSGPSPLIGTHHKGRINMKRLFLTFTILAVATAFTAPAFAGLKDAKNKSECEKAGGVWIEKDNRCGVKTQ